MLKLSVVIVNYNVKYFLEQCLLSVEKAMQNVDGDVWVVDNHSADGSVQMVKDRFPNVNCIANYENVGFSVANNQAINKSTAEYVLLLNPDTVVQEDTFEKCVKYMDDHSDVGGLGVKMIDGKGKFLPESKRGLPTPEVAFYKMVGLNKLFPTSKRFGKYHLGYIGENETAEIEVLAGAFMMMRKSVLDEVGLLDETFFMYGEDIDLSYRITQAGYKNVYLPETSIIHYKGESTKRMSVNYVFVFYRAMVIFARKHYTGRSAALFVGLINLSIYFRALLALFQRLALKSWLYLLDAALIMVGLHAIKDYWEEHIKNFENYFSPIYAQTHFPAYTFIWILMVFWSGGYQRPFAMGRVIRGVLAGTVAISALFAFLPSNLQYSRGIILAGTAFAVLSMLVVRFIAHYRRYKNINLGKAANVKTVIVGHAEERDRVLSLLQKSEASNQFLGFVALEPEDHDDVLGSVDRLQDLCELYKVDEVIFCSKDVSSSETMHWMNSMASKQVNFKIVPGDSQFIIGSNAKDINGELYTEEIKFILANPNQLQKKRILDVLMSLALLPLGFVIGWFGKGIMVYYQRLFSVLFGRKSWVSYDSSVDIESLPKIKPGVFNIGDENIGIDMSESMRKKLNYFYAKNYRFERDVNVVINCLFRR